MVILLVFQAIIALALIGVILLQKSEGGGLAGMGGGGAGSGAFTSRGTANFLTRATAVLAAIFMLNCLGMSIVAGKMMRSESRLLSSNVPSEASEPAEDAPAS